MKHWLIVASLLLSYSLVVIPFGHYQHQRLFIEKAGYVPSVNVLRLLSGDQTLFVGTWLIGKAVGYYGGLYQEVNNRLNEPPDHAGMMRILKTGLRLDPYNMDGYYFAQATLVWDVKQIDAANCLLKDGMKYRDWDFYLPYFLGFNNAYFLKNYEQAAKYYQRVAELTGGSLSMRLTGRYLYEAGRVDLAINYLSAMIKGARNKAVKQTLQTRLTAFMAVRSIEQSCHAFVAQYPDVSPDMNLLVKHGFLVDVPVDPYGGEFSIDATCKVVTTSKFAFAHRTKLTHPAKP